MFKFECPYPDPYIQSLAKSGNHYWDRAGSLSVSRCQNTAEWADTQLQLARLRWLPGSFELFLYVLDI